MKKLSAMIFAVALLTGFGSNAKAEFIFGSIAFNQAALVPSGLSDDLLGITSFTTNDFTSGVPKTDHFSITPVGTGVSGLTLDPSTLASWGFSGLSFGTFSAITGLEVSSAYIPGFGNIRSFAFTGTFTPGTLFPGKTGSVGNATVIVSMTQTGTFAAGGGAGRAISSSFTLDVVAPPVPEPSTIVMLGSLCAPAIAIGWMRRRTKSKA